MNKAGTGRRTLLQQGLALLGGGVAIAAGARWSRGTGAQAAPATGAPLTFYARMRPMGARSGNGQADTRLMTSGDLYDAPDGKRIGEVTTNCFCLGTPFGPHTTATSNMEMQVLQLHDGTIFGMSAPNSVPGGPKVHAIVGGTARYAAARGTYVQRSASSPARGHELVEFVVSIAD